MAKAIIHAISSAKRYGGNPDDYVALHETMDTSKEAIADNRHRVLTHHIWFVKRVLTRIHGDTIVIPTTDEGQALANHIAALRAKANELEEYMRVNKLGRIVSVAQIGEDHILEDFGGKYIPTAQDYVVDGKLQMAPWMQNGKSGHPGSFAELANSREVIKIRLD